MTSGLKEARKAMSMSQKEIAEYLRISLKQYQRYESGKIQPPVNLAIKLARLFGVSVEDLFGMDR